ncbi:hypothetical protein POM88_035717 [Heracleum sosnowskyi]|uniref:Protein FAR1-RELATED SEQUENCE n=1 Tax=Heracleum sosnowskyi TaxID=360622 RepID=A0AAD8HP12_9APIA|nr:hypothetical protein POM88_035717 [Heracleum sosnowskyi]
MRNEDNKFPKIVTGMEIEKDAASHYTRSIYYKVRKEIKASCYHMSLDNLVTVDNVKKCMIRDKHVKDKVFQVDLSLSSNDISCSCHLFTRVGYPDEDNHKSTSKEAWFEFQGCIDEVSSDVNALGFVLAGLKCLRAKAREMVKNPQMTKKDVIANIRKRIVGPVEKSADGPDRVRRMCKICKKKSYHDSRNCPQKGLEKNLSIHQVEEPLNGEDTEMSDRNEDEEYIE